MRVKSDAFQYTDEKLHGLWEKLHRGDREPWPDAKRIARLGAAGTRFRAWLDGQESPTAVSQRVREAWRAFHAGDFVQAIKLGNTLGPLGAVVANKAAAIYAMYGRRTESQRRELLEAAIKRGEASVKMLAGWPNAHYMLALALGRYSQELSIVKAAAGGWATRVRTHLERAIALEPSHAEGHVAFGLYHAELVGTLGKIAASLAYGATQDGALEHFERAMELAPASPIVRIEYANGLLRLDDRKNRKRAQELYGQAARFVPKDAMEQFDVERARAGPP